MRRREDHRRVVSPAELVRAAAEAGVDRMTGEDRRAWLNRRGWSPVDFLRAHLAIRRAENARRVP